jgi:hypothetical protein
MVGRTGGIVEKIVWYEKNAWLPQLGGVKLLRAKIVDAEPETKRVWGVFARMLRHKDVNRDHFDELLTKANEVNKFELKLPRLQCNCEVCEKLTLIEEELYAFKDRTTQPQGSEHPQRETADCMEVGSS